MEGSGVRPFQHTPERLHPIGVRLTSNVLSNRVLNRFVIGEDVVGESVVGVDLGVNPFISESYGLFSGPKSHSDSDLMHNPG